MESSKEKERHLFKKIYIKFKNLVIKGTKMTDSFL